MARDRGPNTRPRAAFLVAGGLLLALCTVCLAEPKTEGDWIETNVALGCEFTESGAAHKDWNGLVDGVKDSDVSPGCYATDDAREYPKWVVLDLGRVYNVQQINVYNSLNGNTKTVALYAGTSSTELKYLWKHHFPDRQLRTFQHQFPEMPVRFVKVEFEDTHGGGFGGDAVMYLREVEVIARVPEAEVRESVARSAVVVNFPRSLRLLRRLTLARRYPLTVLIAGAESIGVDEWSGAFESALTTAFDYQPGKTIPPRVVAAELPPLTDKTASSLLVRSASRLQADLVVVALEVPALGATTGVGMETALTTLCSELVGNTECVPVLVLLPCAQAKPADAAAGATQQLRAAMRQVAYLAGVGVVDCENALAASPDTRPDLFGAEGRLNGNGRQFVARTLATALKTYGTD